MARFVGTMVLLIVLLLSALALPPPAEAGGDFLVLLMWGAISTASAEVVFKVVDFIRAQRAEEALAVPESEEEGPPAREVAVGEREATP